MTQLFTFIIGSLCSSVKIGNRLRCLRPRDRVWIPGNMLYSNSQQPNVIQGRPNILFNRHNVLFRLGEHLEKATPINVGYVAGLTWKIRSKLYT